MQTAIDTPTYCLALQQSFWYILKHGPTWLAFKFAKVIIRDLDGQVIIQIQMLIFANNMPNWLNND